MDEAIPDHDLDAEDMQIMSMEISNGLHIDESSFQPMDKPVREQWIRLVKQIAEIKKAGGGVDFESYAETPV